MRMIRTFTIFVVLACQVYFPCFAKDEVQDIKITLIQNENLEWRVQYDFKEPQLAMFFWRSLGDYRTSTWTVLSKDTHLERLNGLDAIWFDQPRKTAEFSLIPYTQGIRAEYTPFLKFSNGGLGVFTGQFEVALMSDKQQIIALNGRASAWEELPISKEIEIHSGQKLISDGKVNRISISNDFSSGAKYIYVGEADVSENDHYIGIIDGNTPAWVLEQLSSIVPTVFDTLSELYQQTNSQKFELLYAFKGFEPSGRHTGGGVIGGNSMVLESSGSMFSIENPLAIQQLRRVLTHESAHLFQFSQASVANRSSSWIHEGGAEAATMFVLTRAGFLSNAELLSEVQTAFNACSDYIANHSLTKSIQNKSQAHYHCGHLIAYITDSALSEHSYFEFWLMLVDQAEVIGQGKRYSAATYFDVMLALNADESIVESLKKMTQQPIESSKKFISTLMLKSGVKATFSEQFELTRFELPK